MITLLLAALLGYALGACTVLASVVLVVAERRS